MSPREINEPTSGPFRRGPAVHLYNVGQAVRLNSEFIHPFMTEGIYHIVCTLPPSRGVPQYRIRNHSEGYERVTTQDQLEPGSGSGSQASTLLERTFGSG